MAIDRQAITDAIFNGTCTPATSVIAPVVDGYRDGRLHVLHARPRGRPRSCSTRPVFDRQQADRPVVQLRRRPRAWMEAVGNQLRENLGVELTSSRATSTSPSTCRCGTRRASPGRSVSAGSWTTRARRTTWSRSTAPTGCVEQLRVLQPEGRRPDHAGQRGSRRRCRHRPYNQAEDLILEDMPMIPMFFGRAFRRCTRTRCDNVSIDAPSATSTRLRNHGQRSSGQLAHRQHSGRRPSDTGRPRSAASC